MTEATAPAEQIATPEAPQETAPETPRERLENIFAEQGVFEAPTEEPEAEPVSEGPARDENGRFVAKEEPAKEATKAKDPEEPKPEEKAEETTEPKPEAEADTFEVPPRFSADAKAAWKDTPTPVKAEMARAHREMSTGLQQYQQAFEPLKPLLALFNNDPRAVAEAGQMYRDIENLVKADLSAGLDQICRNQGTSLAAVAQQISGQPIEAHQAQQTQVINRLQGQVQDLTNQLSALGQTVNTHQTTTVEQQVMQFAAQNPRFNELEGEMARLLQTGYATDLHDAYDKAARLNPAPQPAPAPTPAPEVQPEPAVQTRKSHLSVQGAPASGSNPATRQRSATAREAAQRHLAEHGLI